MARSIHSLVPLRPAHGDPPSGRLDFPLVTQESQGAAKSLARETTGGTRTPPGMSPCTGLRELVLPERALIKRESAYTGTSKRTPDRPARDVMAFSG